MHRLEDMGHRTHGVEVLRRRRLHRDVLLCDQQDPPVPFHGLLHGRKGAFAAHVKHGGKVRESHEPPQNEDRQPDAIVFHL